MEHKEIEKDLKEGILVKWHGLIYENKKKLENRQKGAGIFGKVWREGSYICKIWRVESWKELNVWRWSKDSDNKMESKRKNEEKEKDL